MLERFAAETLSVVCGVVVDGATIVDLPTEQQRPVLPDRVFKIVDAAGAESIVHVEVQVQAEARFELRLATYYALLSTRHGRYPRQVVVLPLGGPFSGRAELGRMRLEYDVVDVTRLDPGVLLAGPLAPLALWSAEDPEGLVEAVVDRIVAVGDVEQQAVLLELVILKGESVAGLMRDSLERRGMGNVLEGTRIGRELEARGEARGMARGLLVVLRDRFGDVPGLEELAVSMAAGGDFEAAFRRIHAAASVEDLSA